MKVTYKVLYIVFNTKIKHLYLNFINHLGKMSNKLSFVLAFAYIIFKIILKQIGMKIRVVDILIQTHSIIKSIQQNLQLFKTIYFYKHRVFYASFRVRECFI